MPAALFKTAEDLEKACDKYFQQCDNEEKGSEKRLYTVVGLALSLGYSCRQSITDLKENKTFTSTIKKAISQIENQRVTLALKNKINTAVSIFDLKNNFGYQDKQDLNVDVNGEIAVKLTEARKRIRKDRKK